MKCIISCEHASNKVPSRFAHLFYGRDKLLSSHQAFDPGAAILARRLAKKLHASVHLGAISRLLIDLNRSQTNRKSLFSAYSRKLQPGERKMLVEKYYAPYREMIEGEIVGIIANSKPVLHISVHSFAPAKNGKVRNADIGLLYDPCRRGEKEMCTFLGRFLQKNVESLRVRKNYPYLGKTDGFTSYLRTKYSENLYAGIEIEINQGLLLNNDLKQKKMADVLAEGISNVQVIKRIF